MRLLADENFPKPIAEALRADGHDVLWARTDCAGWKDGVPLDLPESEGRIVLTLDKASAGCRSAPDPSGTIRRRSVPSSSGHSRESRSARTRVCQRENSMDWAHSYHHGRRNSDGSRTEGLTRHLRLYDRNRHATSPASAGVMLDCTAQALLSMSSPAFLISKIGPESDALLRNLFEHYIHDMAEWLEIDTKDDGSYSHDTSAVWNNGNDAYVTRLGDSLAGFAIIGSAAEWLASEGAHEIREFFVIRRFRRKALGQRMARFLWDRYPGQWLVRVLESNGPAVLFWRTAISSYTHSACAEELRTIAGRRWQFFKFRTAPHSAQT
jgi:predicted acetyltransferase